MFFSENYGYAGLTGASQSYSYLYVTYDGGFTFEKIELPFDTVTELPEIGQSLGFSVEDYDYFEMPELAEESISIQVFTEAGEQDGLIFQSKDEGQTWEFCRE